MAIINIEFNKKSLLTPIGLPLLYRNIKTKQMSKSYSGASFITVIQRKGIWHGFRSESLLALEEDVFILTFWCRGAD